MIFGTFPNSIHIGPLTIRIYAICILFGAFIAYFIAKKRFRELGYYEEILSDFLIRILCIGILGARIWYVIFMWKDFYASHPEEIITIWKGGLAIQGGVVAGLIYAYYFFKKKGIPFLVAGDAIMPGVLIAQACGRWGNFFNQEAYGTKVSLSFLRSLHLPKWLIDQMYINGAYHHPTFLYESVGNIIAFLIIILIIRRFAKKNGTQFFSYFILYGLVRIPVEAMRTDSLMLGPIRMAQLTSVVFILFGLIGIKYLSKKGTLRST